MADLILGERAPAHLSQPTLVHEDAVISIPIEFKRRGGRKEIILPDDEVQSSHTRNFLVTYARALRWSELLEQGRYCTIKALAAAVGLDRSYVAKLLNLSLLSLRIVEGVVAGNEPEGLSVARVRGGIPMVWARQGGMLQDI